MGKTAAGAVWLNADLVSPYDYWQYWRNTEDGDVSRFLKLFTVLPLDEIGRLAALQGSEINEAKKVLATEATALVHGRRAADGRGRYRARTFEEGTLAENLPTVEIATADMASLGVLAAFVRAGLVHRTARRAARSRAAAQGQRHDRHRRKDGVDAGALTPEGVIKLSLGKKRHVLLKPV
jgi:tyrosyl-tRNA synthetase